MLIRYKTLTILTINLPVKPINWILILISPILIALLAAKITS